jgi:hypothetical protein
MKTITQLSWLIVGLMLLSTVSCELFAPLIKNADQYTKRVSYHRGACFGRCEVFTLDLYENGLVVFMGERFTDKPGTWEKTIDRRRATALIDSFDRADFEHYPRTFRTQIPDLSSIDFTYYDADGKPYLTSYRDKAPEELVVLERAMNRLAHETGYRQTSDTIADNKYQPVNNLDREEIIVHLQPEVNPEAWIIRYGKQNVKLKERLSPNGNYYLISADPNIMGSDELLDLLRLDAAVLSAQKNGKVGPRD